MTLSTVKNTSRPWYFLFLPWHPGATAVAMSSQDIRGSQQFEGASADRWRNFAYVGFQLPPEASGGGEVDGPEEPRLGGDSGRRDGLSRNLLVGWENGFSGLGKPGPSRSSEERALTTKILTTFAAAGYTLAAQYDTLDITATGGVGGTGLLLNHLANLDNYGTIAAVSGHDGVHATAGGTIVNGSASAVSALISGYSGVFAQNAAVSVDNFGSISGTGRYGDGLFLVAGGTVTNGAAGDTFASIHGDNSGISAGATATVTNFATITASYSVGIDLQVGGVVTNGSAADPGARISADRGWAIAADTAPATILNFGFISGALSTNVDGGIDLQLGGSLTNGSVQDVTATIVADKDGVDVMSGAATISNFATIGGNYGAAVYFAGSGVAAPSVVINGSAHDTAALLLGETAGAAFARYGTVSNFGTIQAVSESQLSGGVSIARFGTVTNGGGGDTTAIIEGYDGVIAGSGFVHNFATITGVGGSFGNHGVGVLLFGGGGITNGSASDASALIEGTGSGVSIGRYGLNATVTNWGTISAADGDAVDLGDASDTLVVEAGCAFVGRVLGAGGALDLDTGAGTLTGLLAAGTVTVSGSMAATLFENFATLTIGAAASFTTAGAAGLSAGEAVIVAGALTIGAKKFVNAGTIESNGGTLTVKGKVTGSGEAIIKAGVIDFTSTFSQAVAFVGGVGTLELARSQGYGGTITGFSTGGGTALDLGDIAFTGAGEATYSGSRTGGILTVTDGTHTASIHLAGDYRSTHFVAASDGQGGVIIRGGGAAEVPPHAFVAAMAGLGAKAGVAVSLHGWAPHVPSALSAPRIATA